jgi:hypothetical protein
MLFESNIWYEGKWYNKVPLKLDILHKELITYTTNENFQLIIQQEKVDSFTLGNMLYWHVKPNENNKKITEDFYEVLYKNKLTVLARRTKQIKENVSSGGVEKKLNKPMSIIYYNRVYIQKLKTEAVFSICWAANEALFLVI